MQTNDFVNYRITDNTVSEFPKLVFRKVGYVVRKIGTYIKGCEIHNKLQHFCHKICEILFVKNHIC